MMRNTGPYFAEEKVKGGVHMSDYKPIVDYLLTREALNHFENTWVRHSWDDISPLGHVRPFDDELVAVSVKLPEGMAQLMDSMTKSGKAKNRSDYIRRAIAAALYMDEREDAELAARTKAEAETERAQGESGRQGTSSTSSDGKPKGRNGKCPRDK